MWKQHLIYMLLCFLCEFVKANDEKRGSLSNLFRTNYDRCTRRFTPGACRESVRVVWTFQFQIHNCTERLGCATSSRTNRFRRYSSCMRRCRPVAEAYAHLLMWQGMNNTDQMFGRRVATYFEPTEPDYHADDIGDQPLRNLKVDMENLDPADIDILPPDIDFKEAHHLPGSDDLFHGFGD